MTFITETERSTLSSLGNTKECKSQGILNKTISIGGITMPNFKLYYRAIEMKMASN
jgi:hypothetical protein